MNDFTISLSSIGIILSIILRIITSIILLGLVIPLQYKQSKVKNGLKQLRRVLLFSGFLLFWVNTSGLIIIVFRLFVDAKTVKLITDIVSVLNSVGFVALAVLWLLIYLQQFTDKNIQLHAKIEKQEIKDAKAKS